MKIYPLGYRTAIKAMAVFSVVLAVCALLVYAGIQNEAPTVAAVLYGMVALGFLIMVVRMLRLPEQSWVAIDQETISWRTPPKGRHGATPTGAVPLSAVAAVEVVAQEAPLRNRTTLRGHAVRLTLADGGAVILPIWSSASRTAPALTQLVAALRAACRPEVPFATAAVDAVAW